MSNPEAGRPAASAAKQMLQPPAGSPSIHLDALRGFAAFSVLLSHWRNAFFVDYPELGRHNPIVAAAYLVTGLGHQWVIVFFVISGYLVGGSVLRAVGTGLWSWRGYLLTRLSRLYTALLPALLLGGAADWAGMHLAGADVVYNGRGVDDIIGANVHTTLTFRALAANGLFLQGIALPGMAGRHVPTFGSNGPLWSLCNEFWYYILFPMLVLALAGGKKSWRARTGYAVAVLALGWFVGPGIVLLGIPWLMGVLIRYLPNQPAFGPWMRRTAIVTTLVLLGAGLTFTKIHPGLGGDLALGAIVTLLIWVTLHCAVAPLPAGYVRIAQRSAHSSYTLYLVHVPILIFLKASLHLSRAAPSWSFMLVCVGLLAVIVLYAQLVYEVFEKHTGQMRDWIKPYVLRRTGRERRFFASDLSMPINLPLEIEK